MKRSKKENSMKNCGKLEKILKTSENDGKIWRTWGILWKNYCKTLENRSKLWKTSEKLREMLVSFKKFIGKFGEVCSKKLWISKLGKIQCTSKTWSSLRWETWGKFKKILNSKDKLWKTQWKTNHSVFEYDLMEKINNS